MERKEDRGREQILRAARKLFATSGFHQSPMSELASVARVSVGQIYRLFASKNDIIAAIVLDDSTIRLEEMHRAAVEAESGAISIEAAFHNLVYRTITSGEEALACEILAEAYRNPTVARTIATLCDRFRVALRRLACVANPDLSEEQIETAEELLLACLFGLRHRAISGPKLRAEETASQVSRMILFALVAPVGERVFEPAA